MNEYELTAREMEVLRALLDYHGQEVADRLGIARQTVRNHVSSIGYKLGCEGSGSGGHTLRACWRKLGWLVAPGEVVEVPRVVITDRRRKVA